MPLEVFKNYPLEKVDLFTSCSTEFLQKVDQIVEQQVIPPGQAIISQGELGTSMYIIQRGEAAVLRDEEVVRTLSDGDVFGEITAICKKQLQPTRCATVQATSVCQCGMLDRPKLLLLMKRFPQDEAKIQHVLQRKIETLQKDGTLPPAEANAWWKQQKVEKEESRGKSLWKKVKVITSVTQAFRSERSEPDPSAAETTDARPFLSERPASARKEERNGPESSHTRSSTRKGSHNFPKKAPARSDPSQHDDDDSGSIRPSEPRSSIRKPHRKPSHGLQKRSVIHSQSEPNDVYGSERSIASEIPGRDLRNVSSKAPPLEPDTDKRAGSIAAEGGEGAELVGNQNAEAEAPREMPFHQRIESARQEQKASQDLRTEGSLVDYNQVSRPSGESVPPNKGEEVAKAYSSFVAASNAHQLHASGVADENNQHLVSANKNIGVDDMLGQGTNLGSTEYFLDESRMGISQQNGLTLTVGSVGAELSTSLAIQSADQVLPSSQCENTPLQNHMFHSTLSRSSSSECSNLSCDPELSCAPTSICLVSTSLNLVPSVLSQQLDEQPSQKSLQSILRPAKPQVRAAATTSVSSAQSARRKLDAIATWKPRSQPSPGWEASQRRRVVYNADSGAKRVAAGGVCLLETELMHPSDTRRHMRPTAASWKRVSCRRYGNDPKAWLRFADVLSASP